MNRREILHSPEPQYVECWREIASQPVVSPDLLRYFLDEHVFACFPDAGVKEFALTALETLVPTQETHEIIELALLYLNKLRELYVRFDPEIMDIVNDGLYIGGIPLTHNGCFTLLPGYKGTVPGLYGGNYDIRCTETYVEIKRTGREGQLTAEPGYFKVKKEEGYAESIVVTKVPMGTKRDANLYYRKLLQYAVDHYPFQTGPIGMYKGKWLTGDNATSKKAEALALEMILKEDYSLEALIAQTEGTPLEVKSPQEIYNQMYQMAYDNLATSRMYHWTEGEIGPEEIVDRMIADLVSTIAAWKTPTGRVLHKHLGFDHVRVGDCHPMFERSLSENIRREKARLLKPALK